MRSSFAAAVLALGLVLSSILFGQPVAVRADELLSNGGFENGTAGWAWDGGNLTSTCEPGKAHEGSCAGLFVTDSSGAGIVQHALVSVQPGGTYTLTAFLLNDDELIESVQVRITWQDREGRYIPHPVPAQPVEDAPGYQPVSINAVQSPSSAAKARISIHLSSYSAGGQLYIDDVSFEGPPPPPTPTPTPLTPTPAATAALTPSPTPTPLVTLTQAPTTTPVPSPTSTAIPTPTPPGMPMGYLLNGGFEEARDGTLVGWQKYGGTLQQTATHRRSGRFAAAHISDTESTKWVYQPVRVQPDRTYVFEGFVLLDNPGVKEVFLRVSWYATDDGSGRAIASSDSTERLTGSDPSFRYLTTGAMLVPVGTRSAKVRVMLVPVSSARATIYLDDMSLHEAPTEMPPNLTASPSPTSQAASPEQDEPGPDNPAAESTRFSETLGQAVAPGESPYQVKINEVMYDPAQSGDDASYEWIELYNAGDEPADLTNWTISDNWASDTLPPTSLPPGSFAVVAAGEEFHSVYPAFDGSLVTLDDGKIGNGLANKGDHLTLRDASGKLVDALSYGEDEDVLSPPVSAVASGHSLERAPPGHDTDSAQDFVDNPRPSPGMGPKAAVVSSGTAPKPGANSRGDSDVQASQSSGSSGIGVWARVATGAGLLALAVGLGIAMYWRRARSRG